MLKRITFTGVDDATRIQDLVNLSDYNPFVEWGVLMREAGQAGRRSNGEVSRFPSSATMKNLVRASYDSPVKIQLAAHLCDAAVLMALDARDVGGLIDMVIEPENIGGAHHAFARVQINTHGEPHALREGWFSPLMKSGKEIILQLDGVTSLCALTELRSRACLDSASDALVIADIFSGLHDLSHGAGVLPDAWPRPISDLKWTGYAGGLGPHNLAEQLPRIIEASGEAPTWIDMETHVRTDGRFDVSKVRECLEIVRPFVRWP